MLSWDCTQQKDVPVQLLEEGESRGADEQFCDRPWPYRAIATGEGLVAILPYAKLHHWLHQVPQLRDHLYQSTSIRQQLIFLKVATELRTQPSHVLKRLLPYLTETSIPAGSELAQATPTQAGRWWLRQGKIQGHTEPLPVIGDSWGFPDAVPADWSAATELQVYYLASDYWEMAQVIVPSLKPGSAVSGTPLTRSLAVRSRHSASDRPLPQPVLTQTAQRPVLSLSQTIPIRFAQPTPTKRRWRWFGQNYSFIQ
ncbi:hypothetical protein [Leptodesmis sp.]|uniref:hypothetical protein n=1 Tax=Leptodesmis sp. TaxID=3100501 RepID=UPI0040534DCE